MTLVADGRIATLTSRQKFVLEQVPIPAWHLEILEKRLADLAANPKAGRSWDAVLARLTRRTRRL